MYYSFNFFFFRFKELHPQFFSPEKSMGEAAFFRARPKHVLSFTKAKLKACLCDVCENPRLKMKALNNKQPGVWAALHNHSSGRDHVPPRDADIGFHMLKCVSRQCDKCSVEALRERLLTILANSNEGSRPVTWWGWTILTDEKGRKTTEKVKYEGDATRLVNALVDDVTILCKFTCMFF